MSDNPDKTLNLNQSSERNEGLSPGRTIENKYEVVSLIGRGGMGAVYKVHQILLGKEFALKVLDLHNHSDISVRRFQQEARTTSQLQHPNLVEVHDFGMIDDTQPFLVMDLVEGESLSETLKKVGTLPPDYVVSLSIQICFGLMYAHDKGVVHRDIKPANIMLLHPDRSFTEGTVKVVDFGIAKLTQSEDGEIQTLTKTGEIFGSPLYMSPEQCRGTAVDKRSDIYSLGCVMYECLTGSPPFYGDNAMSTMMKRLSEQPLSLKEGSLGRDFPPLLESIVRKMLATEPADRYQDFSAVIKDLLTLQRNDQSDATDLNLKVQAPQKKVLQNKQILLLVVASLLSIAATATFDRFVIFKDFNKTNSPPPLPTEPKKRVVENLERLTVPADKKMEKSVGLNPDLEYSSVKVQKNANGRDVMLIHFPIEIGSVGLPEHKKIAAVGNFEVPPGEEVDLALNSAASEDTETLKNLTTVPIRRLDFAPSIYVNNKDIAILEKFRHLRQVCFNRSIVNSLKPLYNNAILDVLDAAGAPIPMSEYLKVSSLGKLKAISCGPFEEPYVIFDALAKTANIKNLRYVGNLESGQKNAGKTVLTGSGLSQKDVDSLSKLGRLRTLAIESCPLFDDSALEKLLVLKELRQLVIKDCKLSSRSIPILRKLKDQLRTLIIADENLSSHDRAALKEIFGKRFGEDKTRAEKLLERQSYVDTILNR